MMNFLALGRDANDLQSIFANRYDETADVDPVALQLRFSELKRRCEEIKPKILQIQSVREELVETLQSIRSTRSLAQRIPELKDQLECSEKAVEVARRSAKSGSNQTGRNAVRRAMNVDRDVRLASAMNAANSAENTKSITISGEMCEKVATIIDGPSTQTRLQAAADLILRCGGKLPTITLDEDVIRALTELGIVTQGTNASELRLSRRFGMLVL